MIRALTVNLPFLATFQDYERKQLSDSLSKVFLNAVTLGNESLGMPHVYYLYSRKPRECENNRENISVEVNEGKFWSIQDLTKNRVLTIFYFSLIL